MACAYAQTNVTVYGVVDAGLQISKFGNGTQTNLASGMADGSRLGFKGSEDLGDGYKTVFNLEARIELDTGANSNGYPVPSNVGQALINGLPSATAAALTPFLQPEKIVNPSGALFDRTSMLGLITPYGGILLGRQYTPGYEVLAGADTFEAGTAAGWGSITGGTGGFLTSGVALRANHSAQYRLQLPKGFSMAAMYGSNDTGSLNVAKRFWGMNVKYQAKGWNAGIGYNTEEDPVGNRSLASLVAGGSYTQGNVKVFAGFLKMKNEHSPLEPLLAPLTGATIAAIIGENAKLDAYSYTLGMHYRAGSGRIMTSISRTHNRLRTDSDVTLYGLGYDYNLSKRTDVYAVTAYAGNEAHAQYGLGGAGFTGGFTSQPGQDAAVIQLGMRHKF
jgi:predicted porin